jgi:hypothetical protein
MTGSGQTGSWGDVRCMTVLPPKAEVDLRSCDVADVPNADSCIAANISRSFEQCVGTKQERFWNHEAHGLRSLQVNGQLELRGLLYR